MFLEIAPPALFLDLLRQLGWQACLSLGLFSYLYDLGVGLEDSLIYTGPNLAL
jgi:hypothetical protein